ncbi:MAG: hypothetical protein ACM3N7_11625 [Planctomycetaceae bacterium]
MSRKEAEKLSREELAGKYLLGEFVYRPERKGIVERYQEFLKAHRKE